MPTECKHGRILDWGDFGGESSRPERCAECAIAQAATRVDDAVRVLLKNGAEIVDDGKLDWQGEEIGPRLVFRLPEETPDD